MKVNLKATHQIPSMGPVLEAGVGLAIGVAAFWLPLLLLTIPSYFFIDTWSAVYAATLWIIFYLSLNLRFYEQGEYRIVERARRFWRVKTSWHLYCMRGFIDKDAHVGSLGYKTEKLFATEKLDFDGGVSAPVLAEVWFSVGDRELSFEERVQDILNYTYLYRPGDAEKALVQMVEDELRPQLQKLTITDASEQRIEIVKSVLDAIKEEMKSVGLYLRKVKPIPFQDIDIPAEVIEMRQKAQEGAATATEVELRFAGYHRTIESLAGKNTADKTASGTVKEGETNPPSEPEPPMTRKEAMDFFLQMSAFETIQKTGANVSLVAENMAGIQKILRIGPQEKAGAAS